MPSAENVELSVSIDAGDTLTALNNINKNIELMATKTKETSNKIKESGGIFGDLLKFETIKRAFDAVTEFFKESITEASEAVRVNAIWSQSIQKAGLSIVQAKKDVKEIAEVNAFSEDDIKKIYNYGQALGLSGAILTKFVKTTVDYSAATGKEMLLSIRRVSTEAQKGAAEFERFSANIRGAGKNAADADGGLRRFSVAYKEIQEALGKPIILALSQELDKTNKLIQGGKDSADSFGYTIYVLTARLIQLVNLFANIPKMFESIGERFSLRMQIIQNQLQSIYLGIVDPLRKKALDVETESLKNTLFQKRQIAQEDIKGLTTLLTKQQYIDAENATAKSTLNITETQTALTEKQLKAIQEIQGSIEKISKSIGDLFPSTNVMTQDFNKLLGTVQSVSDEVEKIKKNMADSGGIILSAGDLFAVFQTVNTVIESIVTSLNNLVSSSNKEAEYQDKVAKSLRDQATELETINLLLAEAQGKAQQDANIKKQNSETTKQQIKDEEIVLKNLKDKLALDQKAIDATKNFSSDAKKFTEDSIAAGKAKSEALQKAYDNSGILGLFKDSSLLAQKKQIDDLLVTLQTNLDLINATNAAKSDQVTVNGEIAASEQKIIELKQQAKVIDDQNLIDTEALKQQLAELKGNQTDSVDAINQQLSALTDMLANTDDLNTKLQIQIQMEQLKKQLLVDQTGQLQTQSDLTSTIIDNMIKGGLIDVQNVSASQNILGALSSAGYSQSQILQNANNYGLQGNSALTNQVINIQVDEATGDTVDSAVSGRLSKIFGGR